MSRIVVTANQMYGPQLVIIVSSASLYACYILTCTNCKSILTPLANGSRRSSFS